MWLKIIQENHDWPKTSWSLRDNLRRVAKDGGPSHSGQDEGSSLDIVCSLRHQEWPSDRWLCTTWAQAWAGLNRNRRTISPLHQVRLSIERTWQAASPAPRRYLQFYRNFRWPQRSWILQEARFPRSWWENKAIFWSLTCHWALWRVPLDGLSIAQFHSHCLNPNYWPT